MTEPKPYFRLYNLSEQDVVFWLTQGYKLVAVVGGNNATPTYNTVYHFAHRDYA